MNPFWNREEKRLRAFWRILIFGLFFFIGTIVIGFFIGIIQFFFLAASGQINADILNDPTALAQLMVGAGNPFFFIANGVGTVLVVIGGFFLAGRLLDRRKFRSFGFHVTKHWWRDFGFGLLLGAVLMAIVFALELVFGWIEITGYFDISRSLYAFGPAIAISLFGFIFVGIYEEMLFRGYFMRNLAEGLNIRQLGARGGLWIAYLLSSSVFGIAHLANPNSSFISTFNIFLAGIFLGLGFVLTGELAIPIGLHITWNFFQGNIFGFPVSGGRPATSVFAINQLGPEWMTGGAFGPEAGAIGIFAMLLGSVLTLMYVKKVYGTLRIRYELAVYEKATSVVATLDEDM